MSIHRTVRTSAAGLAAAALAAATFAGPAPAQAAAAKPTSIAQVLAADGHRFDRNWSDFDILDAAVGAVLEAKPDSPVGVLAKGRTKLTAFAPTDRAFRKLAHTLTKSWPKTEKATFNAIAKAAGIDTVEQVLLYHVVPGRTLTAAKVVKGDGSKLTTAQGGRITVHVGSKQVTLGDADPDRPNPRVIATDINKGNPQIAHAIDRVLLPIDL
ncbi:fasciclin domain-containing protein [Nocardioides sp. URHA0032]|uniref:fasciclin domain-containing protein n=1 Tax=Nocardioides sp. URHA0032 TaxID=1380388 RepID=UPI00048E19DF|nr:fasciclin domain-containing protein [Nocardioides sp. URHA0032]